MSGSRTIVWESDLLRAEFDPDLGGWSSLRGTDDPQRTEFVLNPALVPEWDRPDAPWFGTARIAVEVGGETLHLPPRSPDAPAAPVRPKVAATADRILVEHEPTDGIGVRHEYARAPRGIRWDVTVANRRPEPVVLRQVGFPLPMNQWFRGDDRQKYERCVLRHACLTHADSWWYWAKSSGDAPLLVLKTIGDTTVDSFDVDREHPVWGSQSSFSEAFEGLCTAYAVDQRTDRFPDRTGPRVLPAGQDVVFSFLLSMQPDHEAMNRWLAADGGLHVESALGMVLPVGTATTVRARCDERPVIRADADADRIGAVTASAGGGWEFELVLQGFGRRTIGIEHDGRTSFITFFGIEAPERIFEQQAAFITANQWETDPGDPAYHGLLMWDMAGRRRINASVDSGLPDWMAGGSDEIGLVSGLFLSEWNVHRPDEQQLKVLQSYCDDFIEARLTEQPGWRVHRAVPWYTMFDPWTGRGADDVWRAFNYVHVANTYLNMHRIASRYRDRHPWLHPARVWLEKAGRFAEAMFSLWMFPSGVGADQFGNMGESVLATDLPAALAAEGLTEQAARLTNLVRKKTEWFREQEYPFGSEMAYDSTAFEAVYGYGSTVGDERVMRRSVDAVVANRGRQPAWQLHMTDLRAGGDSSWNVSYMTQLGATALYDWVLERGHHDPALVRALHASFLAGFSIFNSGGYFDDASENVGASGWIMNAEQGAASGRVGAEPLMKGLVALSGESALGWFGALRCAASIVSRDGEEWSAFGCTMRAEHDGYRVEPSDGLRARFFDLDHGCAVVLDRDALLAVGRDGGGYEVAIENITGDAHVTRLRVRLPAGRWQLTGGEDGPSLIDAGDGWSTTSVRLPSGAATRLRLARR